MRVVTFVFYRDLAVGAQRVSGRCIGHTLPLKSVWKTGDLIPLARIPLQIHSGHYLYWLFHLLRGRHDCPTIRFHILQEGCLPSLVRMFLQMFLASKTTPQGCPSPATNESFSAIALSATFASAAPAAP